MRFQQRLSVVKLSRFSKHEQKSSLNSTGINFTHWRNQQRYYNDPASALLLSNNTFGALSRSSFLS